MTTINSGKPYEALLQAVFQTIVNQEEVRNITVERDVILRGKSGISHQIDLYWKFESAGITYETIVQAKDWKKPLDQGELLKFRGVLDDLLGQSKGIVVSRTGYQDGARKFALAHGILIYEFRTYEPLPALPVIAGGWARYGVLRMPLHGILFDSSETIDPKTFVALGFDMEVFTPTYSNLRLLVSAHPELSDKDLPQLSSIPLGERILYNEAGLEVGNLGNRLQKLAMESHGKGLMEDILTLVFEEPTFISTPLTTIPRLKLDQVSATVSIESRRETRRGQMKGFGQWVLHDINSDRRRWFAATDAVAASLTGLERRSPR